MSDDGAIPESRWDDYESGPYCEHWNDPGSCDRCALENEAVKTAIRDAYRAGLERAAEIAGEWVRRRANMASAAGAAGAHFVGVVTVHVEAESDCRAIRDAIRSEAEKVRNG